MRRLATLTALVALTALYAPALLADVKTTEKTLMKFEGMMGTMAGIFGGSAMKDGITSVVAVKGNRKLTMNDTTGQIADLTEQKVYQLDVKKKQYTVMTFAQLRQKMEEAKAEMEKQMKNMKPADKEQAQKAGAEMETEFDIKETGQRKQIAGYDTHEVVLTVTMHEKGRKIDDSGGFAMANHMWMGPKIAALEEIGEFDVKFMKAVMGDAFMLDMQQQMAQMAAMYPQMQQMSAKLQAEGRKLQGTTISSVTTFEAVQSAEAMKAAAQQPPPQQSGGGGLGGMIGRRLTGNRASGPPPQRLTVMTTTHDLLSIEKSATDADVAIPAGYKEKK